MKISKRKHVDPSWGYLELEGGCIVAMPKKAMKELQAEIKQLKKEVADYHQLQWQYDALIDENEKLKGEREEANSWDDAWKMAEQITQLEKCLVNARNENEKLKCLALLIASEMYWFKSQCNRYEGSDWWTKMKRQSVYYRKAYRKAKKELK